MTDRPILFIGMRRCGTTSLYKQARKKYPARTGRIKETFTLNSYNPIFSQYTKPFKCEEDRIIEFCPSVYGSWLALLNLLYFKEKHGFDPILVLIRRDEHSFAQSMVKYLKRRNVVSNGQFDFQIDAALSQISCVEFDKVINDNFQVYNYHFSELESDPGQFLKQIYADTGLDLGQSLENENTSAGGFYSNLPTRMLMFSYRKIRGFIPEAMELKIKQSMMIKRIFTNDKPVNDEYMNSVLRYLDQCLSGKRSER